jgi:hypothetical protein
MTSEVVSNSVSSRYRAKYGPTAYPSRSWRRVYCEYGNRLYSMAGPANARLAMLSNVDESRLARPPSDQ